MGHRWGLLSSQVLPSRKGLQYRSQIPPVSRMPSALLHFLDEPRSRGKETQGCQELFDEVHPPCLAAGSAAYPQASVVSFAYLCLIRNVFLFSISQVLAVFHLPHFLFLSCSVSWEAELCRLYGVSRGLEQRKFRSYVPAGLSLQSQTPFERLLPAATGLTGFWKLFLLFIPQSLEIVTTTWTGFLTIHVRFP